MRGRCRTACTSRELPALVALVADEAVVLAMPGEHGVAGAAARARSRSRGTGHGRPCRGGSGRGSPARRAASASSEARLQVAPEHAAVARVQFFAQVDDVGSGHGGRRNGLRMRAVRRDGADAFVEARAACSYAARRALVGDDVGRGAAEHDDGALRRASSMATSRAW